MSYYKISQNNVVVGAGCAYLRWHPNKRRYFYCDVDAAELVQDAITAKLYHADWLAEPPAGADPVEDAAVTIISATEYDEIIAMLDDGETIPDTPEPDPAPEPVPDPDPAPDERPMTVQEMREKIAELTSMCAKDNIPKGSYFVLHDEVYQATDPIVKGAEIKPGYNCEKKTLAEFISQKGE